MIEVRIEMIGGTMVEGSLDREEDLAGLKEAVGEGVLATVAKTAKQEVLINGRNVVAVEVHR